MKRKKENKTRGLYDYKYYNHKKYIKKNNNNNKLLKII